MPTTPTSQPIQSTEVVASLQSELKKRTAERDRYKQMYLDTLHLVRRLELGLVRGREKDLGEATPMSLLALMGAMEPAPKPADDEEKTNVPAHERKKPTGRKPLPENLPRVVVEVLPDEVKLQGLDAFEKIGEDVSETVERRPAAIVVVREVRPKFVPKGQARGDETKVAQAEPMEKPIPRGLAGPGLLADTIVKRWADHTPLHRMERIYARDGLDLARQTVCHWHIDLARLVKALIDAMWADALDSPYLCVDATGVLVQHPEKCKNGFFFVVAAPEKHVLFRFALKHNNATIDALLGKYLGVLVADAHVVYDHLFIAGTIREAGCWAHARRYFFKALSTEPQRSRAALDLIGRLFAAERALTNVSAEKRQEQRKVHHAPIVEEFERWCDAEALKVLDEAPLAKAIQYARNQRAALRTFLDDGRVPLDNNWSERELRRIAWGRDNWLFVGSEDGGDAAATFVSLIASCQQHGIEPLGYLRDLLCLLPSWPVKKVLELAPAYWRATIERTDVRDLLAKSVFRQVALGQLEPTPKK